MCVLPGDPWTETTAIFNAEVQSEDAQGHCAEDVYDGEEHETEIPARGYAAAVGEEGGELCTSEPEKLDGQGYTSMLARAFDV